MKTIHFFKAIIAMGILAITTFGCEPKEDPVTEELDVNRVFAPTNLEAFIRNMTSIELNWNVRDDAEKYIVEFAEDSLEFNTIIRTVEVFAEDLPIQEQFFGDTRYSARVKGVAEGKEDSKWATITIQTNSEQIFLPIQPGDIQATEATLRWPENSEVTHFLITPGNIERSITAGEISTGIATITGLQSETAYTVILYNNASVRGTANFATLIDIGDATLVQPEDDLNVVISAAQSGDVLVLMPGDYTVFSGNIILDKSLTIQGLYPYDKPVVYVSFALTTGLLNLELINLEMVGIDINALGGPVVMATVLNITGTGNYNSVSITGCDIHDFGRQLIYGNPSGVVLTDFSVDNSVMSNFIGGGGDFIDFRAGNVHNIEITNSTFFNTPNGRDFIRMDAAGTTNGTGITATVLIDHCTFVGVANTEDRIVYVRFNNNDITVTNNLFASTDAKYSNQTSTDTEITFAFNNYFNAPNLFSSAETRYDTSSNFTTLDPGFVDAANGDFTVTNQSLIDDGIGDPRWLQ